jgi:hypothetical protein
MEENVTTVATQWSLHKRIPPSDEPRFAWSDEHGRHVSVGKQVRRSRKDDEVRKLAARIWNDQPESPLTHGQVIDRIISHAAKSKSDAKRKLQSMQDLNLVQKVEGGTGYRLTARGQNGSEPDLSA